MDLVEWGAKTFEVQTKQINFEILQLLSLFSNLGVVQNMISPAMSKTAYVWYEKTQGILGVKLDRKLTIEIKKTLATFLDNSNK